MADREVLQKRIENTCEELIQDIEKAYMRKSKADLHRCALNCYERPSGSHRSDHECAQACQVKNNRAEAVLNHCFEEYNRTLTNCMERCVDSVRYSKDLSAESEERVMSCTKTCVDEFVNKKSAVFDKCLNMLRTNGKS